MPGLSLACFLPAFLKLSQLPFASGLLSFSISVYLSLLLSLWLTGCLAPDGLLLFSCSLFLLLLFVSPIHTLCVLAPPIFVPASLLAIQIFIRTIRCFRQAQKHSFTELNKYSVNVSHTPENNIPNTGGSQGVCWQSQPNESTMINKR